MIDVEVTIRLAGLSRILRQLEAPATSQPIKDMLEKWSVRYRAFLTERFVLNAKGGGEWPPLKYRVGSILWDTGTLITALSPTEFGNPGSMNEVTSDGLGVTVGYGGNDTHPTGGHITSIADIAGFHQVGAGFLPVRQIIVDPNNDTINDMATDMKVAIGELKNG